MLLCFLFFFFNDTATTEIYTLSLHDALPIFPADVKEPYLAEYWSSNYATRHRTSARSEEHTSELQSRLHLVCRLLLEKKKKLHRLVKQVRLPISVGIDRHHSYLHLVVSSLLT